MNTHDFYFELPERLIAQTPLKDRSASRLLVLDKKSGEIKHKSFKDIIDFIKPGDCLVINETKVIPARLIGSCNNGKRAELLLLSRLHEEPGCWEALSSPGKKTRAGDRLVFGDGLLTAEIIKVKEDGNRIVRFTHEGIFEEILDRLGQMPLPPYIKEKLSDRDRYQTVYAKNEGSAAAPTAGLHFTESLLAELQKKGVRIAKLTLHVGLGTFRPVRVENIYEHKMHSEYFNIENDQCNIINETVKSGGRIIAVGTTSCRTLETLAYDREVNPGSGYTDIFIYPGYEFKITDCLITNFHLPESTLIMLVSALGGRESVLNAYKEAVACDYRFYSFGDCMLIL